MDSALRVAERLPPPGIEDEAPSAWASEPSEPYEIDELRREQERADATSAGLTT